MHDWPHGAEVAAFHGGQISLQYVRIDKEHHSAFVHHHYRGGPGIRPAIPRVAEEIGVPG
jgi:hypothetical protein